jgi:hypothetical protein
MTTRLAEIASRHADKGVVLDTGLLLLLFVGQVDRRLIGRFKRTQQYSGDDFNLLVTLIERLGRPLATPHIIAEVGNLAGQLKGPLRESLFAELMVWLVHPATEISVETRLIQEFEPHVIARFGITDCVTMIAASHYLVITDDSGLATELTSQARDVLNFRQLESEL